MLFKQKIISTYFCRFSPSFHLASMIVVTSSIQESRGARDLKRFCYKNCKWAKYKSTGEPWGERSENILSQKLQKRNTKYKSRGEAEASDLRRFVDTIRNAQYAIRNMPYAIHNMPYAIHNMQNAIRNTQYTICNAQYAIRNTRCKDTGEAKYMDTKCKIQNMNFKWQNTKDKRQNILHSSPVGHLEILFHGVGKYVETEGNLANEGVIWSLKANTWDQEKS